MIYSAITMWLGKLKVTRSLLYISYCSILVLLCHLRVTFLEYQEKLQQVSVSIYFGGFSGPYLEPVKEFS